jgi:hypothetical protein
MSSSFLFPNKGSSNSLNTPNCSFIDGFGGNNLEIEPDSSPFCYDDQIPSFDLLMDSDAAFSDVQSPSDGLEYATPSFQNSGLPSACRRLFGQTGSSSSAESGFPQNSESYPSESAGIDLSLLCHDLGIKSAETGSSSSSGTRSKTPQRLGSQGKRNEHRKTLSQEEMTSLIESHKKKSRYWYDKFKSAETARESLNRRLKRYQMEASKTEFQEVSKTMKEWELAFKKSRDHMTHSCRNMEKAFAILKESVVQKHLSRSASESTLAYEEGECSEHHQEPKRMNSERVPASATSSATCVPSRVMDPAGDTGAKKRSSLLMTSSASKKQTLPTQSFSELLALASSQTAISSLNETPARLSGGSKSALKPISRLAVSKEQNSISKKYLQVTKEIRDARARTPAPASASSKRASVDGIKSCLSRGRPKSESKVTTSSNNKSQKDAKVKATPVSSINKGRDMGSSARN